MLCCPPSAHSVSGEEGFCGSSGPCGPRGWVTEKTHTHKRTCSRTGLSAGTSSDRTCTERTHLERTCSDRTYSERTCWRTGHSQKNLTQNLLKKNSLKNWAHVSWTTLSWWCQACRWVSVSHIWELFAAPPISTDLWQLVCGRLNLLHTSRQRSKCWVGNRAMGSRSGRTVTWSVL